MTQEQATLEQTFARNIAEQERNSLPGRMPSSPSASAVAPMAGSALASPPGQVNGAPVVTIKFAHGVTRLAAAARQQLRDFAPRAKQHEGIIRIVGHSSSRTGNMSYAKHLVSNFDVSVDRANAVARELIGLGVDPARLKVEAVGASMPRYHETMPNGEAENRRVEVFLQ